MNVRQKKFFKRFVSLLLCCVIAFLQIATYIAIENPDYDGWSLKITT